MSRRRVLAGTAASAVLVLGLAACSTAGAPEPATSPGAAATSATGAAATSAGDGGTTADRLDSAAEATDLKVVTDLLGSMLPDPGSAAARDAATSSVASDAVVHDGSAQAAGPDALLARFSAVQSRVPGAQLVTKHLASDGDLVAVHWQATATPSDETTGEAEVDLFRVADGKVAEAWALSQPVPATSASGNSMFSDLYQGDEAAPVPTEEDEEAQRTFAVQAYDTLFRDQDASVLDRSFSPGYLQHNAIAPNGTDALKGFFAAGSQIPRSESVVSLSDGDVVWTFSRPVGAAADAPFGAVDLFRVDSSGSSPTIVEHWDVVPQAG